MLKFFVPCLGLTLLLAACGGSDSAPVASENPAGFDHPPVTAIEADSHDMASLEQALEKNPSHTPILLRMAELALQSGDAAKAVDHLRAAVEAEPENMDARLELGRALYESGDIDGAVSETEALLKMSPNHVDALYNLGAIQANRGNRDAAIGYWSQAASIAPQSPSGQSAQRGLDVLQGRSRPIPDIPEHRGLTQTQAPRSLSPQERNRLIDFAVQTAN